MCVVSSEQPVAKTPDKHKEEYYTEKLSIFDSNVPCKLSTSKGLM